MAERHRDRRSAQNEHHQRRGRLRQEIKRRLLAHRRSVAGPKVLAIQRDHPLCHLDPRMPAGTEREGECVPLPEVGEI